ncbi:MAG: type VI secretion system ATPase TssH, partial [Bacteroidales bacterium]|nr:type VI secretion system ATPase TssH [Bacteroidales bacterium]
MNFNNFTIKAQEAVQKAVDRAKAGGQQAITPTHLLAGVLEAGENVTQYLLGKLGVNEKMLVTAVESQLASMPRVSGGEPYLDREANAVMQRAMDVARADGDTF